MIDERALLIEALTKASESQRTTTSLLSGPSDEFVRNMSEAIGQCPSFQAIKGGVLFCPSVTVSNIVENLFMSPLAIRSFTRTDLSADADWLLKMWRTRKTRGYHVSAIWGLSLSRAIEISPTDTLMPFTDVPDCPFKMTIMDRARNKQSVYPWQSRAEWQVPTAAFVREVPDWLYISENPRAAGEWFPTLDDLDFFSMMAIQIGTPIVVGSGSALRDGSLDLFSYGHFIHWEHPEVAPLVEHVAELDPDEFEKRWNAFLALPVEWRKRLLRAAARFNLSQCRLARIDRVLDLALAYEIVLGGGLDTNAGISWRIAVRTAQLVGGPVNERIRIRKQINDFYQLRSRATHGNDPAISDEKVDPVVALFLRVFNALVHLGREPNWNEIELGPASHDPDA